MSNMYQDLRSQQTNEPVQANTNSGTVAKPTFAGSLILYQSNTTSEPSADVPQLSNAAILLGGKEKLVPLFRASLIECVATTLQQVLHTGILLSVGNIAPQIPPPVTLAFTHWAMLTLIIFAAAAPSGAHMNPTITWATTFTGHTTVIRAACYTTAQLIGSVLGSFLMRVVVGWDKAVGAQLGLCSHGPMTHGQAFVSEFVFTFCLLFFAFGIAFEPKQRQVFGPVLAPILIGMALGLILFASSSLPSAAGGGPGAGIPSMNWSICFGPSVVLASFEPTHWVYPIGTFACCAVHGLLFLGATPHHETEGWFRPVLLR